MVDELFAGYFSLPEAAEYLRVHHETVARLVRARHLRAIKRGGRWWVKAEDLENFAMTYEGRPGRPIGQAHEDQQALP